MRKHRSEVETADLQDDEKVGDTIFIDSLPNSTHDIKEMLKVVKQYIYEFEYKFFVEEDSEEEQQLRAFYELDKTPNSIDKLLSAKEKSHIKNFYSIPISVDVKHFNFESLSHAQKRNGGRLFDVIAMDPPWQLSSANPTRGVAIAYDTLSDPQIVDMPFDKLQTNGFLFIWVINAKYRIALELFNKFGYKLVDELVWIKQTVNGKIAKGHGYYLQHAKETCLIGYKGDLGDLLNSGIDCDVIFSQRRGQSQKPEEIYEIIEELVPNGYYLEIFSRRNNLHNGWCSIGNEL